MYDPTLKEKLLSNKDSIILDEKCEAQGFKKRIQIQKNIFIRLVLNLWCFNDHENVVFGAY